MKTPTTVLLAIIAALLAANLVANLPPQEATAQAQPPPFPPPVDDSPRLVGITVADWNSTARAALRLWSDGVVEQRRLNIVPGGIAWHPSDDWAEVEVP